MTLTLTLANVDALENGEPTRLVIDRHGALIGRAPNADWCLPDPKKHISFTHCEIIYRVGEYLLVDKSTNGTFLNGCSERLAEPRRLEDGDEFAVGHYRVAVNLGGEAARAIRHQEAQDSAAWDAPSQPPGAGDWLDAAPAVPQERRGAEAEAWADLPVEKAPVDPWAGASQAAAISGRGAMAANWSPPRVDAPAPAPEVDVWSRFESSNRIDWTGSSFDSAAPATPHHATPQPAANPWSDAPQEQPAASRAEAPAWGGIPQPQPAAPANAAPLPSADEAWNALLAAAGLTPADIKSSPKQAGAAAGAALRRLVGGLMILLEARARAKSELGAAATMIELNGNNPLKFLRQPEAAVARLLGPAERGYMEADRAVEDAFKDLQAHQMASLAAMQGALRATLARFSPQAIRGRAEGRGLLAKILPGAREAALWQAYEREFEGVVRGSDEAFMDFFAKAFREAYQKASQDMKR